MYLLSQLTEFARKKNSKDKGKRKPKIASTKKLLINKQKKVKYNNQTYEISKPSKATQKNKKYQVTVRNISTGQKKTVSWGHKSYQDFLTHGSTQRRERFQKRFSGIKLKDGSKAADNPMQASYYATRYNW